MAEEIVEGGRIYYPPEDINKPDDRVVFHPETDTGQVIDHDGRTLDEILAELKQVIEMDVVHESDLKEYAKKEEIPDSYTKEETKDLINSSMLVLDFYVKKSDLSEIEEADILKLFPEENN